MRTGCLSAGTFAAVQRMARRPSSMKSAPMKVMKRSSSATEIFRSESSTGMPASRASMSTSSQPLSTMGEMTITSILCRINSRTASSWACWSLSASMAVRSTPNSRAASRIDWLFASRQPLSVPTCA